MTATDLFPFITLHHLAERLVNELWKIPSAAQKLALIQDEDAKCTLKAYKLTISFMQEKMTGTDHEEIFLVLQEQGWKAAFRQARVIFKQKRKAAVSTTSRHILYEKLRQFLQTSFYAYIGYDGSAMSSADFFSLQEAGEAKLAAALGMSSADAAGNLVFLSLDRLKVKEIAELVPTMETRGFIATLRHIESLTKARKY